MCSLERCVGTSMSNLSVVTGFPQSCNAPDVKGSIQKKVFAKFVVTPIAYFEYLTLKNQKAKTIWQ